MKRKRLVAIVISTLFVLSNLGFASMAEPMDVQKNVTDNSISRIASPSDAEKDWNDTDEVWNNVDDTWNDIEDLNAVEAIDSQIDERIELASDSNAAEVYTEEELVAAVKNSDIIIVKEDIELSKSIAINAKTITLKSEGATLYCKDNFPDEVMLEIGNNANVTLEDIEIDATKLGNPQTPDKEYFSIVAYGTSNLVIEDGTIITSDPDTADGSIFNKGGISISSKGEMNGGSISGFPKQGILVSGEFRFNGGEITDISNKSDPEQGGGAISIQGQAIVSGGSIYDCYIGIFNNRNFIMNGGEIFNNQIGVINNNRDNMSGAIYKPEATLSEGHIYGNTKSALINRDGGIFNITEGTIDGIYDGINAYSIKAAKAGKRYVIQNSKSASLTIAGGDINSTADNEIAIWIDDTSKLSMIGGQINVSGNQAVAIVNENNQKGGVKLSGGAIQVSGTDSQSLKNQGYVEITNDVLINEESGNQFLVRVSASEGGIVSPSSQMVAKDQKVTFEFSPKTGYRVADVIVDGNHLGRISQYTLQVTKAHSLEVMFETYSSGGNIGGGGGSSSGSSRISSGTTQPAIPETPGTWKQDATGWKFMMTDTTAYINTWIYIGGHWYRTGTDGYMLQGWNTIDGKQYYLTPVSGELKTGWLSDNNFWFYLDSSGAMQTGWVQVNGKWYFLDSNGKMAVDTTTEDGYKLGADGAWMQ